MPQYKEQYSHVMHGRSRMTIDPRTSENAGTEHVLCSPTRQTLVAYTKREEKREVLCQL